MPQCDKHRGRTLVCRSRRRQRERSVDRIAELFSIRSKELKMSYPKTSAKRRRELLSIRKGLVK